MQDIRDLKTRDVEMLNETIREMMEKWKHPNPVGDNELLVKAIERFPFKMFIIRCSELKMWVFTNILDDDLVYQEYFNDINFVIVERDLNLALARGIHYRYHKKVRP